MASALYTDYFEPNNVSKDKISKMSPGIMLPPQEGPKIIPGLQIKPIVRGEDP